MDKLKKYQTESEENFDASNKNVVKIIIDVYGHETYREKESKSIVLFVDSAEHKSVSDLSVGLSHLLLIEDSVSAKRKESESAEEVRWNLHLACKECQMATESFYLLEECISRYGTHIEGIVLAITSPAVSDLAFAWLRQLVSFSVFSALKRIIFYPTSSFMLTAEPWLLAVKKINSNYALCDIRRTDDLRYRISNDGNGKDRIALKIFDSSSLYPHISVPYVYEYSQSVEENGRTKAIKAITKVIFPRVYAIAEHQFVSQGKNIFKTIEEEVNPLNLGEGIVYRDALITENEHPGERSRATRENLFRKLVEHRDRFVHPAYHREFSDFSAFIYMLLTLEETENNERLVTPFFNMLDQSSVRKTENIILTVAEIQDSYRQAEAADRVKCVKASMVGLTDSDQNSPVHAARNQLNNIHDKIRNVVDEWDKIVIEMDSRLSAKKQEIVICLKNERADDWSRIEDHISLQDEIEVNTHYTEETHGSVEFNSIGSLTEEFNKHISERSVLFLEKNRIDAEKSRVASDIEAGNQSLLSERSTLEGEVNQLSYEKEGSLRISDRLVDLRNTRIKRRQQVHDSDSDNEYGQEDEERENRRKLVLKKRGLNRSIAARTKSINSIQNSISRIEKSIKGFEQELERYQIKERKNSSQRGTNRKKISAEIKKIFSFMNSADSELKLEDCIDWEVTGAPLISKLAGKIDFSKLKIVRTNSLLVDEIKNDFRIRYEKVKMADVPTDEIVRYLWKSARMQYFLDSSVAYFDTALSKGQLVTIESMLGDQTDIFLIWSGYLKRHQNDSDLEFGRDLDRLVAKDGQFYGMDRRLYISAIIESVAPDARSNYIADLLNEYGLEQLDLELLDHTEREIIEREDVSIDEKASHIANLSVVKQLQLFSAYRVFGMDEDYDYASLDLENNSGCLSAYFTTDDLVDIVLSSTLPDSTPLVVERTDHFITDHVEKMLFQLLTICSHVPNYDYRRISSFLKYCCIEGYRDSSSSEDDKLCVIDLLSKKIGLSDDNDKALCDLLDRMVTRLTQDEFGKIDEGRLISLTRLKHIYKNYNPHTSDNEILRVLKSTSDCHNVFICYARSDGTEIAQNIRRDFSTYEDVVGEKRKIRVFSDIDLESNSTWLPVLAHMIDLSDTIVIVVTDDSLTNQVYGSGFIRNYEARKITENYFSRPAGRNRPKVLFVDGVNEYVESELVSHVYGHELAAIYRLKQRFRASDNSIFSSNDIRKLL